MVRPPQSSKNRSKWQKKLNKRDHRNRIADYMLLQEKQIYRERKVVHWGPDMRLVPSQEQCMIWNMQASTSVSIKAFLA
jgi:hypothetical protein